MIKLHDIIIINVQMKMTGATDQIIYIIILNINAVRHEDIVSAFIFGFIIASFANNADAIAR